MDNKLRSAIRATACFGSALLSACSAAATGAPPAALRPSATDRSASASASSTCMTSQCVYVTNTKPQRVSSITAYPISASGNVAPAIDIAGPATGLIDATGIAVDAQHNIYVSNIVAGSPTNSEVTSSPPARPADPRRCRRSAEPNTDSSSPKAIAIDASRNIYVANRRSAALPRASTSTLPARTATSRRSGGSQAPTPASPTRTGSPSTRAATST